MDHRLAALLGAVALGLAASLLIAPPAVCAEGQVLLLDNGHAVLGDILLRGDVYVVRRAGGEMSIPASKVLMVCDNMEHAFKLYSSQANQRDVNERLRLAQWCRTHGLREQAVAEAKAALSLAPGHAEAVRLLVVFERESSPPPSAASSAPANAVDDVQAPILTPPNFELTGDCLAIFANKVQPILMNACASCHATGRGGPFVLTRPTEASGRRTLQSNLAATIKYICFEKPSLSVLLDKACSTHGGMEGAPSLSQQTPPFQTMQGWVDLVASRNPHLKSHGTKAAVAMPSVQRPVDKSTGQAIAPDFAFASSVPSSAPTQVAVTTMTDGPPVARAVPSELALAGAPAPLRPLNATPNENWQPASEFDPMIFNRMWHGPK